MFDNDVPHSKELEKEAEASVAKGIKPGQIEFTVGTKVPNYITSHQVFPKNGSLYIFPPIAGQYLTRIGVNLSPLIVNIFRGNYSSIVYT